MTNNTPIEQKKIEMIYELSRLHEKLNDIDIGAIALLTFFIVGVAAGIL